MGVVNNIFNLRLLVGSLLTAVGVGLVAWVLSLILALMSGLGAFASVVTAVILLVLLGMAVKMRSGDEDVIQLLTIAMIVIIVFGLFSAFGLGFAAPVFNLSTPLGFATAAVVLIFGEVLGLRVTSMIGIK